MANVDRVSFNIKVNNRRLVLDEFERRMPIILEAVGLKMEGNAIKEINKLVYDTPENPDFPRTGRLRNSITYACERGQGQPNTQPGWKCEPSDYKPHGRAESNKVYVGTNVEYAASVELGTSVNRKRGPRPYLRNAVAEHREEYERLIQDGLEG